MKEEFGVQLENGSLRFVRDLPGPIERVWEHFVDPEKRALWFCGGTMAERPGETFIFAFDHSQLSNQELPDRFAFLEGGAEYTVKLVEIDPPNRLVFADFGGDEEDGQVEIDLEMVGDRVRLTLIQSPHHDFAQLISAAAGWQAHLGLLIDIVAGDPRRDFWVEHATAEPHYEALLRPVD